MKINHEEYEMLKNLDNKWKWIARDGESLMYGGELQAYTEMPQKRASVMWSNGWGSEKLSVGGLFQFIRWEDSKPYNIQELIKEYEYESEEAGVKDIEWLKEEMDNMHRKRDLDRNPDEWFISKTALLKAIDQLDEPEVLSSDWIKDNQLIWTNTHGSESYIPSSKLYGKIVPKQE